MRAFFAYLRVSTAKQGEKGVSLQEQRELIARYAEQRQFQIAAWFEERQTAAKRGRPIFDQMLRRLKQREVEGLIVHKIDRSARNLRDWADLGELIDRGIEVHFANENLDLRSRAGRLSADLQAVVAADFIRNLREETRKGFYGRLRQGLYPLPAPLGYLDQGRGQPKQVDPIQGPLVRQAFQFYASGRYSLDGLISEIHSRGLRSRRGGRVSRNGLSVLFNNVFYLGLIQIRRTGETFQGVHEPLISKSLFDRVQRVLRDKTNKRQISHDFLFRGLFKCRHCGRTLSGELQKGRVYYRCHAKSCPTTCIREDTLEHVITDALARLEFSPEELTYLRHELETFDNDWATNAETARKLLILRRGQLQERLNRLTDAFLDRVIDQSLFETRKAALLLEQKELEEKLYETERGTPSVPARLVEFFELAKTAHLLYRMAIPVEKRELVEIVTSNREVDGRNGSVELREPFRTVAERANVPLGDPQRDTLRTGKALLGRLVEWFTAHPESRFNVSTHRGQ